MGANVKITAIHGVGEFIVPGDGVITLRGHKKGKKAKPCKCMACGDEISVGEQYIRIGEEIAERYCLGCAEYY